MKRDCGEAVAEAASDNRSTSSSLALPLSAEERCEWTVAKLLSKLAFLMLL